VATAQEHQQRSSANWADGWTPFGNGRPRASRVPPRGSYSRAAAPRHGANPAVDALVAVATLIAAFVLMNLTENQVIGLAEFLKMRISVKNVMLIAVLSYCWVALFRSFGLYDARRIMGWEEETLRVIGACLLGALVALIFPVTSVSRAFRFDTTALFFVGVTFNTLVVRRIGHMLTERGTTGGVRNLVIVGSGPRARRAYREMCLGDQPQYVCLGFIDSEPVPMNGTPIRMLGGIAELESLLVQEPIDEVLIALPIKSQYAGVQRALRICERMGVQATYLADVFEHGLARPRFEQAESLAVVTLPTRADDSRLMVKRGIDIAGASLAVVMLSPVLLVAALAVKITSPGPVFFIQPRYGYNRRRFPMIKFRTMVVDAEQRMKDVEHLNEAAGPIFKIKKDPRVTKIGSFLRESSVDELPQLFNVLLGHMSLVGPRPMSVRDVSRFSEATLMRRFSVLPGMTGLWQVSGRSSLTFTDWIALDLKYIDNWSLTEDLRILLITVPVVVRGRGAM
jgi:exopolysaccharide biosynthesis polyprenyl glycosylphosphotransferase